MIVKRGRVSQIVPIRILDTTSVTGGGKTGLVNNSTNLTAYYHRELDTAATAISLLSTTSGIYLSGGFVESDATHLAGQYELGLPNAAISASDASTWVEVMIYDSGTGLGIAPVVMRIDLVAVDLQDAVHMGLSTLPNAAAGTNTGLPVLDSNLRVSASVGDIVAAALAKFFTQDSGTTYASAVAGSVVKEIVSNISTSAIADAVWNRLTTALTTVGSIGKLIVDKLGLIGNGTIFTSIPVSSDGATVLVRGASYLAADGRSLVYTLSGYPALPIGSPCFWRAKKVQNGGVLEVTGIITAADEMTFELTAAETAVLDSGKYSLKVDLDISPTGEDIIKTPNDTLRILESI